MMPRTAPALHIPPPLILVAGFLVGYGLEVIYPLKLHPAAPALLWLTIQTLLWVAGVAFGLWAFVTFARARTGVLPGQTVTSFVTHGPYRHSRNPMYAGLTMIYLGFAVKCNSVWPLILLAPTLWALWKLVVQKEERFLTEQYGEEYTAYQMRVRRWL